MDVKILNRDAHAISRKNFSSASLRVLYGLKDAGFDAFVVGGAVRDLLLGVVPKDFDIATNATPEEIQRTFRSCRLVGRRFRIAHVRFGGEIIEVTTFRGSGDGEEGERRVEEGGRILRDNVFGSIAEDAKRRDFTVNALYYNIADFAVSDFEGGVADLEKRQLRLIGDAETRYREDPVRMLRAARLAAKLNFTLEPATEAAIAPLIGLLAEIPPARLFDEIQKLFLSGHARASWRELMRLKLFGQLFPSLTRAVLEPSLGLIAAAIENTDRRVAQGRPVTPAFLFAVLGWALYQYRHGKQGLTFDAQSIAFDRALDDIGRRVALTRRFATQVREIWDLQDRLTDTTPSRAKRLLPSARFRAAYDFLLLRAQADPNLAECAECWTRAQEPGADLDDIFALYQEGPEQAPRPAAKRRKRKRTGASRAATVLAPAQ